MSSLKQKAAPRGQKIVKVMVLEVRPGEGGQDAYVFACELVDAFRSFTLKAGGSFTEVGGVDTRTMLFEVSGDKALATLGSFTGVHRIQRIPLNDKRGRRHTSTATVALVAPNDATRPPLDKNDLRIEFYRGTGPGGQHRNKVSTAVRVKHLPTGLIVTRETGRSQSTNLEDAMRDMEGRLSELARLDARESLNEERTRQVYATSGEGSNRAAKSFTHNQQRDEVLCHEDSRRWRLSAFMRGKLSE
jgi:peptide chain release factor 1